MTIDITKIRAANTGTDLAANIHPATILAMCDEIERLRKDAEVWDMAARAKDRLARCHADATQDMREQIIETAQAKGFWSVWMTVFADDPVMLLKLERK